jgi:hypothetical protein
MLRGLPGCHTGCVIKENLRVILDQFIFSNKFSRHLSAQPLAPTSPPPEHGASMGGGDVGANGCAVGGDL